VDYLLREIDMHAALLGDDRYVEQMHWGGGTPTFLPVSDIKRLASALRENFDFSDTAELAIEIDPRTVDEDGIALLASLGFNRVSLGVQDFDPAVQAAVNRMQGEAETVTIIQAARAAGFRSVNVDLIYGLPKQNVEGFNKTLDRVISALPDRIALYNYAHLPEIFKPQRRINADDLPSPDAKLFILSLAIRRLMDAGYVYIGMDHFARPDDELAVAQTQGRLQRNFQGYSTRANCDLIAFGVSAIGAIGPSYYQNHRQLDDYYDAIDHGALPIMRGIELTADDLVRRAVINSLMCHFELSIEALEIAHLIDFERYFARELEELAELERDGLIAIEDRWIRVTASGRLLVRTIGMVFDRYLRERLERGRYSKVI
jgi:oxygen-independent coproporphyrinogen-3 oxidase